jgi:hypothetical protein
MKYFRSYLATIDRLATSQIRDIGRAKLHRTLLTTTIVVGSQFLSAISTTANPVPTPARPNPLLPTRVILNPSFEEPIVRTWDEPNLSSTTGSASADIDGGNIREAYNEPMANPAAKPIIWRTTDTGGTRAKYGFGDAIEVWRGIPDPAKYYGQTTTSGAGVQYAELNGSSNASLYQDICVMPSENVSWSLLHAARVVGETNIMQVSITDPTGWSSSKTPPTSQPGAYYSAITSGAATTDRPYIATQYSQGWQSYSGSWTSPNTTNPKHLRFAFGAIQGSIGSIGDITYGNFIDNVQVSLPALIDFLPTTGGNVNLTSHTEGNTTNYYYLSVRINGKISTSGQVRISLFGLHPARSFRLGTVLKGSAAATGLSATANGNLILLDLPAGTYDPNSPSNYIHIPIDFSDTVKHPNDNLTFTLESVVSGDLTIKSTRCSTDIVTVETQLLDDDVAGYQKRVELPIRIATQ